jgi:CHASE2 domain-containing sensor protein
LKGRLSYRQGASYRKLFRQNQASDIARGLSQISRDESISGLSTEQGLLIMTRYDEIRQSWHQIQPYARDSWRQVLPGLVVLGIIVGARMLGLFEGLELKMLDTLLRWRPAEPTDERVLIVGINEADIQQMGDYPIPDGDLAELLKKLDQHQPRAIGIDIYRDFPVAPGHEEFVDTLAALPNVVGIEKVLYNPVPPPPSLPPEQVGFIDLPLDADGFVRRVILGEYGADGGYHFALSLQLARIYLNDLGMNLDNGVRDPHAMRFGDTELTRLNPSTGGYVRANISSNEVFLNPRSGPTPFRIVSLQEVMDDEVDPAWIEDAVVLIGITSLSVKDLVNSAAVASDNPGLVYGVEIQAHATSQLIHAVVEGRPLLRTWPDALEYLWIIVWGGVSILLIRWISSPSWYLLAIGLTGLGLFAISYGLLWVGALWIPLVPTLVAFSVNGLVLPGFYLYDQTLRSRIAQRQRLIEERQRVIEQTYNDIHNGPLQTLAILLRDSGETMAWPEALPKLRLMDEELRSIYESLLATPPAVEGLNVQPKPANPREQTLLHERLAEIYHQTLQRDFPGFKSINLKLVNFECLNADGLSSDDQQALCHFFEETLCNVGKHANQPTRLTINCQATDHENVIHVEDNGKAASAPQSASKLNGRGTRQAKQLASHLHGTFDRTITEAGTRCELRWPIERRKGWLQF